MKIKTLVALGGLMLLFIIPVIAQDMPALESTACPFAIPEGETEGKSIACYFLTVPESRTGLSNATLQLLITLLYPAGEALIDPIIYFAGGPGGSAASELDGWLTHPFREYAPLILLEQRGTSYSLPTLNCPEITERVSATPEKDCYNRLIKEGIAVGAYTSAENAADVSDLITASRLESVNLYGISYGTRLALTVMANHPQKIRSVILNGVYPPNVQAYEEQPVNTVRVFRLMFKQCAGDSECNAAFPELEDTLYAMITDLNKEPLTLLNAEGITIDMTGDDMLIEIFNLFYDTGAITYAPAAVYAAAHRDADKLSYFLYGKAIDSAANTTRPALRQADNDGDSEGMFNSVECADEVPFNSFDVVEKTVASLKLNPVWAEAMLTYLANQMFSCKLWAVPQSDKRIRGATVSAIPTLILNGEYDPITPPNWGEKAARTLSNSFVYTIPAAGHNVLDTSDCPEAIAREFLIDPATEPDSTCLADLPPVLWFVDYVPGE